VISPARRICFRLLSQIESRGVYSDAALNSKLMETADHRNRHLITEIVYGTLRWQSRLDYILAGVSSRPWSDVETEVKILLRMSLYQMWHMDRIPDHALVNDAVELAKKHLKRGIDRFLNGILRHLTRNRPWEDKRNLQDEPKWIRVSLPQWLWKRWAERYGENMAMKYAEALNTPPLAALRLGSDPGIGKLSFRVYPSDLVPGAYIRITGAGETIREDPEPLPFQDEASQLIPHLLGPIRGWRLWDACAAPGGKTAVLCDKSGQSGMVVASDRSREKARRLAQTLKSSHPFVLVADASIPSPFRAQFDAVVVDVPCSGLGTLRRNPEIKWRFCQSDLPSLQKNQLNILNSVSENVRPGGKLLYSTCSTEPEENEQVVEGFIKEHPGYRIERPAYPNGIHAWTGSDSMVRTFPGTRLWDGLFAALMVRDG
jgi:16S rRNA (cytosine967-C5)-methyltransferase